MTRLKLKFGVCLVLLGGTVVSCDCEERIRKAISRDNVQKNFEDLGESSQPREEEPNNAREQATLVELGSELRDVTGRVASAEDVDWFSIRTDGGEAWLLTLKVVPKSDAFDPAIELEVDPSSSETVVYDTAGPAEPEVIRHLGVSDEVRRFGIRGGDSGYGPYRIEFSRQLTAGSVEREPNDLRKAATNYEFPGEIQGFYGRPEDRDWYHVVRSEADTGVYRFRVKSDLEFSQTVELYTRRDSDEPYATYQVPPTEGFELPNLRVPEEIDGLWFRFEAGEKYSLESGYHLRLVEHPPEEDARIEAEPNDEADEAMGVEMDDTVRGYLHSPSDLDRFELAVGRPLPDEIGDAGLGEEDGGGSEGEATPDTGVGEESPGSEGPVSPIERVDEKEAPEHVVQVGLKPTSEKDRLKLVWWREGTEASPIELEASESGETATICNHPIDRGLMHLGVRGAELEERDVRGGFAYELAAVDIVSEVENLEIEPNDSRERADRLAFGESRTAYISRPGDRDVFAFGIPRSRRRGASSGGQLGEQSENDSSLGRGRRGSSRGEGGGRDDSRRPERLTESERSTEEVRVELAANELDFAFRVLDEEGGLVAEIDRHGAGANESANLDLPPGLYFVEVESDGGRLCKPYELTVKRTF